MWIGGLRSASRKQTVCYERFAKQVFFSPFCIWFGIQCSIWCQFRFHCISKRLTCNHHSDTRICPLIVEICFLVCLYSADTFRSTFFFSGFFAHKIKQSTSIIWGFFFPFDRQIFHRISRVFWPTHSDQSQKWYIKFRPILLLSALIELWFVFYALLWTEWSICCTNKQFFVCQCSFFILFFVVVVVGILMLQFISGID